MGCKKEKLIDFYLIPLNHISFPKEYKKTQTSLMKAIDKYYYTKATEEKKISLENELNKKTNHLLKKSRKKLKKQQKEYNESENAEKYKIFGELLTANLYRFSKEKLESDNIEVTNYYEDPPKTIKINLDKSLSPSENAQRYFKKYQKAKTRNKKLKKEIKNTEAEIKYLENISFQLESAEDLEELDTIKEELIKEGYLSEKKQDIKKKKKTDPTKKSSLEFISKDGFKILVGKNNKQNDYLTLKEASSEDIWLHTKEIAGSHVVIKGKDAPLSTIEEAASIAAYYSKGKNSSNVPVDYTRIKHVRKPKGAKPGMVFYDNYKTLFVDPVKPAD
ncbi:Rqc2 family fibronectin-binding protein [Natranaerofaba carboxydovora]|uniref:Rqc2 family fibronectin-binding protein n=1 Tax=Natranaerofaba carboxydovora TaxID=2742683 RepID=UPI001F12BFD9|nr:NFACT family protein [Natranaerofaba carboxydovora]UMZ73287.1 hypothetical protein ACONDI_00840 [Natranaerofaba carboxydovora]